MNKIVVGIIFGTVAGIIDVIPMLIQKLTWDANLSALAGQLDPDRWYDPDLGRSFGLGGRSFRQMKKKWSTSIAPEMSCGGCLGGIETN
jgi:hypothetical protein